MILRYPLETSVSGRWRKKGQRIKREAIRARNSGGRASGTWTGMVAVTAQGC